MPLYYFHIFDHRVCIDTDGCDLPDDIAVRVAAMRLAGEKLRDEARHLARRTHWRMEVADATGRIVYWIDLNTSQAFAPIGEVPG